MKHILRMITALFMVGVLMTFLLLSPFLLAYVYDQYQKYTIKREIFELVLEKRQGTAPLEYEQHFTYALRGEEYGTHVRYGYYHSARDRYGSRGYAYKDGCRIDNYREQNNVWYYEQKICDEWYYYEIHRN